MRRRSIRRYALRAFVLAALACSQFLCLQIHAAENVTLRNGSAFLCTHQEPAGDRIRLYLYPTSSVDASQREANYIDVSAASVLRIETVPDPVLPVAADAPHLEQTWERTPNGCATSRGDPGVPACSLNGQPLTPAETRQLLARAGQAHNIDADLLASVVHAESGGNPRAVSRAGARGLMQLMPATAANLGVSNSFAPDQNVAGGTQYLDQMLTRYHDNIAFALAAYNAGPEAVDRYRGIPPYGETRAYVARIIREFNRRKLAARANSAPPPLR